MVTVESVHSEWVPFGVSTHQTSNGEPQTHENCWFPGIYSIRPVREKFAEFNCTIVFKSEQNGGDVVENWHGRLKLTLVVNESVNAICRSVCDVLM